MQSTASCVLSKHECPYSRVPSLADVTRAGITGQHAACPSAAGTL